MTYRLVALDLDGTLLDSHLQIRRETIDALDRVRQRGIETMIVTGRHHVAAYPYWRQLDLELPAICCNGAYVYDFKARTPVSGNPLSREEALALLRLVRQHGIDAMVYVDEFMAFERDSPHYAGMRRWSASLPENVRPRIEQVSSYERLIDESPAIWKFLASGDDIPAMRALATAVDATLGLRCEWSGQNRLDITRAGNSKGSRLTEWIAGRGIALEQVIAFGDQENDLDMLHAVGMGVAMGNGVEVVRERANWVTGSNDSNGIADALHRFVLTPA